MSIYTRQRKKQQKKIRGIKRASVPCIKYYKIVTISIYCDFVLKFSMIYKLSIYTRVIYDTETKKNRVRPSPFTVKLLGFFFCSYFEKEREKIFRKNTGSCTRQLLSIRAVFGEFTIKFTPVVISSRESFRVKLFKLGKCGGGKRFKAVFGVNVVRDALNNFPAAAPSYKLTG